ncbi:PilN family type IVB pilus formation outer membrane protein [Pectobacterium brasiliense]|uniref:PilN family type IVB pilus formation outer membrane protein n=1 Tax=Pectobacterium brasiliense TaxID=180957 RepID=A0A3S1A3R5_9GAMM|nr:MULTISPECIES: PilN family type IVB pilus formation outer membrane protein [Pectobacterium]GKW29497.1 type IVB pilus formation outer membrane protein, R64 PilN family [Pectobacterium carotovorum subsp. carotovorum]MBN3048127.1 PilN family type IVB pilus formation outer membrane protein [Pectobacterium brasiliense]MBN3057101.1 PilN family type IVB pilus formation outer membrane protein [Pectobacterium brasiliense]MBN3077586.1 PilN family type IVB pilus formation outer membrane protein [Pectoba
MQRPAFLSLRRAALSVTALTVMAVLSGCALTEIRKLEDDAHTSGQQARRITESQTSKLQSAVTWVDKPWVNLNPIIAPLSDDGKKLSYCSFRINRPEGMSLLELGQRLTRTCGIRVVIMPDVAQMQSASVSNVATQQMSGTLPIPDDNGRVALSRISDSSQTSQPSPNTSAPSPSGLHLGAVKWSGDRIAELMDNIAVQLGLSWRSDGPNQVVFYYSETKTYQLAMLNTKTESTASVISGTSSSMGASGGSSVAGAASGDASSSQKTTTDLSSELYEDIRKTVETMLTPQKGRFWLSAASGALTVTDTPQVQAQVARFVEYQNEVLNRQVQLNVQLLSVTRSKTDQMGLDWSMVYRSLNNVGATMTGSFGGAADNAMSGGVSILESATGNAAKFSGSNALFKALSEQGAVSVDMSQAAPTTNLSPAPFQLSDQTVYIARASTTATTNAGSTSSLEPGMITTGLNVTMLPFIKENGDVQLQFSFNLSDPPTISSFTTRDGNSRMDMPHTRLRSLTRKVNLRAGQSLVLTGFEQVNTTTKKSGMFTPDNFLFGGGRAGDNTRTSLVIVITPVVLR